MIGAGFFQICCALIRFTFECGIKQFFDLLPAFGRHKHSVEWQVMSDKRRVMSKKEMANFNLVTRRLSLPDRAKPSPCASHV